MQWHSRHVAYSTSDSQGSSRGPVAGGASKRVCGIVHSPDLSLHGLIELDLLRKAHWQHPPSSMGSPI